LIDHSTAARRTDHLLNLMPIYFMRGGVNSIIRIIAGTRGTQIETTTKLQIGIGGLLLVACRNIQNSNRSKPRLVLIFELSACRRKTVYKNRINRDLVATRRLALVSQLRDDSVLLVLVTHFSR